MMKRLFILAALAFSPLTASAWVIQHAQPSGGGGGGSPAIETIGTTISSSVVTSSSMVFTCGGSTDMLLVGISLRRGAGQDPTHVTWSDGSTTYNMTLSTRTSSSHQFRNYWYYLSNPASGTGNIVVTYSAATTGVGVVSASITGTTSTAPVNPYIHTTQSVTTSSATATTSTGDIFLSLMIKQDSTTSEPTLNTADATLHKDLDYSSGGNGGHLKFASVVADASSETINYSWTTAANHAHAGIVIIP